jgi:hypothetical protein
MVRRKTEDRPAEARTLERELRRLMAGTNDLRRRTGQVLWHLDRTLIFWDRRGRGFFDVVRLWLPAAAGVFESTARAIAEHGRPDADGRLRRFVAGVLEHLADELDRGDLRLHPFLRWLEGRFPTLTAMMQAERPDSRLYDADLARTLGETFLLASGDDRAALTSRLRSTAHAVA